MTTRKLKSQFADVEMPFAAARMLRGVHSAGYSQVMPSHPIPKKVLNTKLYRSGCVIVMAHVRTALLRQQQIQRHHCRRSLLRH